MTRSLKNTFLAFTVLTFAACAAPTATARGLEVTTVNANCPIKTDEAVDTSVTTAYGDEVIGFCCKGCVSKWDKWDDAKKSDFVAKSMK